MSLSIIKHISSVQHEPIQAGNESKHDLAKPQHQVLPNDLQKNIETIRNECTVIQMTVSRCAQRRRVGFKP